MSTLTPGNRPPVESSTVTSTRPVNTCADAVAATPSAIASAAATAVSLLVLQFMPSDPPQKRVQEPFTGYRSRYAAGRECSRSIGRQQNLEAGRNRHRPIYRLRTLVNTDSLRAFLLRRSDDPSSGRRVRVFLRS